MANLIALNVYLLKKGRYPFKEIDLDGFKPAFEVRVGPEQTSMVYFKMSGGEPDWLKSLKSISSFAGNVGESKSPQAMIFVRSRQRWFVLTFGQAWQKVSNTEIVPDFGTRCVLNIAHADSLVSIRRDRIATSSIQAIEQIPDADDIQRFGLDVEQDMLRGVKARVDESYGFGSAVVGGDSFKGVVDLDSDSMLSFCRRALRHYGKSKIATNFEWYDKISPAPDHKVPALERRLARALSLGVRAITFSIPAFLAWDEYDTFCFKVGKRGHQPVSEPLDPLHWRKAHVTGRVTESVLSNSYVYAYKLGNSYLVKKWPLRKCVNATVRLGSETYVTQSGAWYRVASDFVQQIEQLVDSIPTDNHRYPALRAAEDEGSYNKRIAMSFASRYFCLDRNNVHVTGRSYIEACDLLRYDGSFICVKPWGGKSQQLSHLFQQAVVSGQLISSHPPYVAGVENAIGSANYGQIWRREAGKVSGATFVLALIRGVPKERLPFFAKVGLASCVRSMRQMRFVVKYAKIT